MLQRTLGHETKISMRQPERGCNPLPMRPVPPKVGEDSNRNIPLMLQRADSQRVRHPELARQCWRYFARIIRKRSTQNGALRMFFS